MRILVAHNRYLVPGGEDQSTRSEVEMLRDAGHAVDLWEVSNESIGAIGAVGAGIRAVWSRPAMAELRERLARQTYDVLHVQNHFPLLSPAIHRVATARGVATVQHLRNFRMMCVNAAFFRDGADCQDCRTSFAPWRGVARGCYRGSRAASLAPAAMVAGHRLMGTWQNHVDLYVAVSRYVRDAHADAGFPAGRIAVRGNVTKAPVLPTGIVPRRAIVAPARLSPEKGIDLLIRAWRMRPRQATLHIAGSGPEEPALKALAAGDPSIRFEGQLGHADLLRLIAGARAAVSPSLNMEPFGRAPIEAFSVGVPAITPDAGGFLDSVEHGVNGLLFRSGDAAALDQALTEMLADDAGRTRMAAGAAETFRARFAPNVMLKATEAIYAEAIARRRSLMRGRPAATAATPTVSARS